MKVAFVTFEYLPNIIGGAGIYAVNIVRELARLGHEIHVITPSNEGSSEERTANGITLHRIRYFDFPYFSAVSAMLTLRLAITAINKSVGGFDIIHENSQHAFQLLFQFFPQRVLPIPHVVTVHVLSYQSLSGKRASFLSRLTNRGEENYLTEFAERSMLHRANKLIANSLYTKNILISQYGIEDSKIKLIYMGHPNYNSEKTNLKSKKSRYLLRDVKEPLLLFVGRMVSRKGLQYLLKAAKELKIREVKFKLIIVGAGPDEGLYKSRIKELDLEQYTIFAGFVDDLTLKELYEASNVVTVPSINEPFGLVVLEAMFAGKPIVASKTGGIPEIIDNNANGILVDPKETEKYADALQNFLQDSEKCAIIGKVNHEKAVERFTWNACARDLSMIYDSLIENDCS